MDESALEEVICDSICSSVGTIEDDIFTPREERFENAEEQNDTDGKIEGLAGPINFLRLQRPDSGQDVTSLAQKMKLDSPITLKIPIKVPDAARSGNTRSKRAVDSSSTTMRPVVSCCKD